MSRKVKCSVKGCSSVRILVRDDTSGEGETARKTVSMFKARTDEDLARWRVAIPGGASLTFHQHVCEFHFEEGDINKHDDNVGTSNDSNLTMQRRVLLRKGAVPSIFPAVSEQNCSRSKTIDCVHTSYNPDEGYPDALKSIFATNANSSVSNSNFGQKANLPCTSMSTDNYNEDVEMLSVVDAHNISMVLDVGSDVGKDVSSRNATITNAEKFVNICNEYDENSRCVSMPGDWIPQTLNTNQLHALQWFNWTADGMTCEKRILLTSNMELKIFIHGKEAAVRRDTNIESCKDIEQLIHYVSHFIDPCKGVDDADNLRSPKCTWHVVKKVGSPGPQATRCIECSMARSRWKKRLDDKQKQLRERQKRQKWVKICKNLKKTADRRKKKIVQLKAEVVNIKKKCAQTSQEVLQKICENLPENQQLNVQACVAASKIKDKRGIRYTTQWIYECLMLRIKSRKTYKHLQTHNILALPSITTLHRYMKKVKGAYGFQESTFELLKTKTEKMEPSDVRGVILVDEMKLAKTLSFNQKNLQFEGFTDLGKYTPKHQAGAKGDHALVVMFQPFKGKWVQTLGCFLSKGSATGTVLHQILIEGINLAEKAGLRVDAVTSDGASWNRNMWEQFGVDEENISIPHISDENRRLWFLSDFPHLIKCLRNFLSKQGKYDQIWTPDGAISLKHWYALLSIEDPKGYNLKVSYKLREEHIRPQYYQKMNVAMAFQFFGVGDAMTVLKDNHPDLSDCEGSIKFCKRVKELIRAMNSRTPMDNLKPGNTMWKVIEDFIAFLEEWEVKAKEQGNNFEFMTDNTCYGLKISLKATLQVCEFLVKICGFKYLMTARLNQDSLERFFGMMRHYCGSNDHPDSALFIQTYKLVSTYSLIRPPKGSNVTSQELIKALIELKDIEDENQRREQWELQIDSLLDKGLRMNTLSDVALVTDEHDYFKCTSSDFVLAYMAGFTARRTSRFAKVKGKDAFGKIGSIVCKNCMESIVLQPQETIPESYKLIEVKDRGALIKPSVQLFNLISILEKAILDVIHRQNISSELLFDITVELENHAPLPLLGCPEHETILTHKIISFFLTTRMFFVAKQSNKNDNIEKETTKEKRKLSKLASSSTAENNIVLAEHPDQVKKKSRKRKTTQKESQDGTENQPTKNKRKKKNDKK